MNRIEWVNKKQLFECFIEMLKRYSNTQLLTCEIKRHVPEKTGKQLGLLFKTIEYFILARDRKVYHGVREVSVDRMSLAENAALASRINSSIRSADVTTVKLSFKSSAVKSPTVHLPFLLMTEEGSPRSEAMIKTLPVFKSSAIIIDSLPYIKIYRKSGIESMWKYQYQNFLKG